MRATKLLSVSTGLACLVICLPKPTSARLHFRIRLGTPFVSDYSHVCCRYYPAYVWHRGYCGYSWLDRGWYRWMDSDRYYWLDGGRYRGPYLYPHWPGHSVCLSGAGLRLWGGCPPITDYPRVVDIPKVVTSSQIGVRSKYNKKTMEFFVKLRQRKHELIQELASEDKERRKEAITESAGYCFDTRIRKALEYVLVSEPDPELRKQVTRLFGKSKNKMAIPALEKAKAEDPDSEVRAEAERAIKELKNFGF